MDLLNKWTILILGIWLISAAAPCVIKSSDPISYAFVAAVLIGIGYMLAYN